MRTLAVLVALVSTGAMAQGKGLTEFLDSAEKANIDRRISAAQREKAVADFRVAWTGLLPSLTVSGAWTHNQSNAEIAFPVFHDPVANMGRFLFNCSADSDCSSGEVCSIPDGEATGVCSTKSEIQKYDQFDLSIRLDVPLIDTARWMRTAAASTAGQSAEQREAVTRDMVRRQVVGAYYGYAAALAVRESAKKSTGVAEAQLKLQEIRANAGAVTELDLLRARAEVQRNRQVVADTESLVATTRRSLATLSGLTPPEALGLPADDMRPEASFTELEGHVKELPAMKAGALDARAADEMATASKLLLVPTLSGQFTERISNTAGFTGQNANYNLGLGLTWRFDVATLMGMSAQDAAAALARLALERTELQLRDQVHSDWQRLTASLIKIEAAASQVTAASRAAQVSRDRYNAGAGTQVDVIQAERDLFSAEVGQIQARTELASARASLRISAGLALDK